MSTRADRTSCVWFETIAYEGQTFVASVRFYWLAGSFLVEGSAVIEGLLA